VSQFQFSDFKEQIDYLTERGLDEITIKRLGLEIKTATWLKEQGFPDFGGLSRGIVWALTDPAGIPSGKFGARVFYQKGIIVDASKPKFLPPKGQVPGVYFSPLSNWDKLEYGQRIYICESYLKADIAAMCGCHAVGISGCWGWSYQNKLNWDFGKLPWTDLGLKPIVCMDSNVCEDNPKLWLAARRLSTALEIEYRVHSGILVLPRKGKGEDWGLDDYYVRFGKEPTLNYLSGEEEPLPSAMSDHLAVLNRQVCVVREISRIAEIDTGQLLSRGDFEGINYANRIVWNEDKKPQSVAKAWMQWEKRTEVEKVVYKPGGDRLQVPDFYNLWEGMGCVPLAGDAKLFTSWVNDVFDTPTEQEFFLDWWAWQLQNLGGKLTTAMVVVGPPGIGKGWVSEIMQRVFGIRNIAKIPLTVLERPFNADIAAKQLMIVEETDEIGGNAAGQRIYNNLKDLITSTTIRLEKKGVDAYLVDNCLNVFLTGNQVGVFKLDEGDRRMAVLECLDQDSKIVNNPDYWDKRYEWVEQGGAEIIYGHLLNRDLAHFNPKGMAPMTKAKGDMTELTHTPLDSWVVELKTHPEDVLRAGHSDVDGYIASARELTWLFFEGRIQMCDIDRAMVNKVNKALKNARVEVANDGRKIKPQGGIPTTYFVVRQLPLSVTNKGSWSALVRDRVFWMHLAASEQGQVAKEGDQVASGKKY